jgi:hypothetical protein
MNDYDEDINFDDIPEITDFSNAIKNPFAGKFKDGFRFRIHHGPPDGGWDEEKFVKREDMKAEISKAEERFARNENDLVARHLVK